MVLVADEKLFSTVMINLIYNSIQEINGDGTIEITINVLNNKIIIKIKDSGTGIPQENIKKWGGDRDFQCQLSLDFFEPGPREPQSPILARLYYVPINNNGLMSV